MFFHETGAKGLHLFLTINQDSNMQTNKLTRNEKEQVLKELRNHINELQKLYDRWKLGTNTNNYPVNFFTSVIFQNGTSQIVQHGVVNPITLYGNLLTGIFEMRDISQRMEFEKKLQNIFAQIEEKLIDKSKLN